jgi:hypothetical protein
MDDRTFVLLTNLFEARAALARGILRRGRQWFVT